MDRQNKIKQKQKKDKLGKADGEQAEKEDKDESMSAFTRDDSDDEEDVFTVKRKDHTIEAHEDSDEDVSELLEAPGSKKKGQVITKAQIAKKLMKKKIQANSKTVFDDSGDVVDDSLKQKVSEAGKLYEDDGEERLGGGIDITKAKEVMSAEDKFDKATERARIKEKHREEKRKKKEENRRLSKAKRGEAEDDDDEEEEEEGSEPDLSWLPDPDELYGKEKGEDEVSDEEAEEQVEVKQGKRKLTVVKKIIPKKKARTEEEEDAVMETGLSLGDAEELAMQLLRQ